MTNFMAKVHPFKPTEFSSSSPCFSSSCYITNRRESFTVWMKSLVMQGNGCTVFNESGEIVYRMDNYDEKSGNEVYLMDLKGQVLFTICKVRKFCLFRQCKGYRSDGLSKFKPQKPEFQVRQNSGLFDKNKSCEVTVKSNSNGGQGSSYRLECLARKSAFKVFNNSNGEVVAEAKRKELSSGVLLGDDVLNLVVESHVDHSLIIALAIVYGMMHNRL